MTEPTKPGNAIVLEVEAFEWVVALMDMLAEVESWPDFPNVEQT